MFREHLLHLFSFLSVVLFEMAVIKSGVKKFSKRQKFLNGSLGFQGNNVYGLLILNRKVWDCFFSFFVPFLKFPIWVFIIFLGGSFMMKGND